MIGFFKGFIFAFVFLPIASVAQLNNDEISYPDSINKAIWGTEEDRERNFALLNEYYTISMENGDTANAIKCLIGITDIERFTGNYNAAFDQLWDALILAEKSDEFIYQAKIHRNIGILYLIYNKDKSAIQNVQKSIEILKAELPKRKNAKGQLVSSYFSMASVYKENKQYDLALLYLDSCVISSSNDNQPYVDTDKGFVYLKQGKYKKAEAFLQKARTTLENKHERYLVVCYANLGDLKMEQNRTDSALYYYNKSLLVQEEINAYLEYKPEVLQKLANIHFDKKSYRQAYQYVSEAKLVSDSLFNAKSERNNQLFEIKNKYKEALAEQEQVVEKQNTLIRQKDKLQVRLIYLIGIVLTLSVVSLLFYRQQTRLKKMQLSQKLESEKNREIVHVKEKELTAYALQMIEKERTISELLEELKEKDPGNYAAQKHKYSKKSKQLWDDFNLRFVKMNSSFYEKLKAKHPDLTVTEQKHCALIKLNFESPEMAQMLNISVQSVHTSRYRIRKKLKLAHQEGLRDYIDRI